MTVFSFFDKAPDYDAAHSFCVQVKPDIACLKELFEFFYQALWFPDYFGHNLDALVDCFRALWETLPDYQQVVLVHWQLPSMQKRELRAYLELLYDVTLELQHQNSHRLVCFFHEIDRDTIAQLRGYKY